jgi:hypothetical protein
MFHLTDLPFGNEGVFYKTVTPMLSKVVNELLDDFLIEVRKVVKNRKQVRFICHLTDRNIIHLNVFCNRDLFPFFKNCCA